MSGAARTASIRVAFEGDEARRKLEELGATGERSLKRVEAATANAQPAMRGLASASDATVGSLRAFGLALASPAQGAAGLAGALTGATAGFGALAASAGLGAAAVARAGDQMTESLARLGAATGNAASARAVFEDLQRLSQQTGVSVAESAGAFARFSIAAREIGATNGEVLSLVRTIQQAGIVAGASAQETAAATQQLAQGLASGRLQGDELRSILENMPNLAEALARELGVGVGQLRQMGAEGQLTADRVLPALVRAGERINAEFNQMPVTMGRAFGVLGQSMTAFLGQLDQALGLSQGVASAAMAASNALNAARGAITPLTDAQRTADAVLASEQRLANLRAEQQRLETAQPVAPRRGTIQRGAVEGAAGATPQAERVAAVREQIAAEERAVREGRERLSALAQQSDEARQAEEASARARREQFNRQAAEREFGEVRGRLDRERALREAHRTAVAAIDRGLAAGATDDAEATRLRAAATRELEDGLRRLAPAAQGAARAVREVNREVFFEDAGGNPNATVFPSQAVEQALGRARDVQERREAEARQAAERALQDATRQREQFERNSLDAFARIGEGALERIGTGLVNAFLQGERGALDFGRLARATLASVASDLLRLAVINPFANAVFGTARPTLGGAASALGQAGGGAAGQAGGGGSLSSIGNVASIASLGNRVSGMFSGSGLGQFFPGAEGAFSGFGSSVLNTPIIASTIPQGTSAALGSMGAQFGPATASQVAAAGGSSGLTIGTALGPAAAIAGGAYGVYSGLQRGGAGGYTSAAGGAISAATGVGMLGAAAGLLPALGALGPAGLLLGAALAIGGSFLPGQRPSEAGGRSSINFATGFTANSQLRNGGANLAASQGAVGGIVEQASALSGQLGFAPVGAAAVGTTRSRLYLEVGDRQQVFGNNEGGRAEMEAAVPGFLFRAFQLAARDAGGLGGTGREDFAALSGDGAFAGADRDRERITLRSNSLDQLRSNLDFLDGAYQQLTRVIEPVAEFEQGLAALAKPFDDAIYRANELGLATDALNRRRDEELTKARAARDVDFWGLMDTLEATAQGDGRRVERIALEAQLRQEFQQTEAQLRAFGASGEELRRGLDNLAAAQTRAREGFDAAGAAMAQAANDNARAADGAMQAWREAADVQARAALDADVAFRGLGSTLRGLEERARAANDALLGENSPLTQGQQFARAFEQFQAGRLDLNAYLGEARQTFGSATAEYAGAFFNATDREVGALDDFNRSAAAAGAFRTMAVEVARGLGMDVDSPLFNANRPGDRVLNAIDWDAYAAIEAQINAPPRARASRGGGEDTPEAEAKQLAALLRQLIQLTAGSGNGQIAGLAEIRDRLAAIEGQGRLAAAA